LIFSGVQADNGTHLVGGGRSPQVQKVIAANTTIQYTRTKGKYRDLLEIPGPTNAFLRVVVSKCSTLFASIAVYPETWIGHFTVVCSVTWPLNGSEAAVNLVFI